MQQLYKVNGILHTITCKHTCMYTWHSHYQPVLSQHIVDCSVRKLDVAT